jgi:carbamoyltransferase
LTGHTARIGPSHPHLAKAGETISRWLSERILGLRGLHRLESGFAHQRIALIRDRLLRGETVYIAGLSPSGTHNSGVALIEVTKSGGPRLILNNEEERFSGNKHTAEYPRLSLHAMAWAMSAIGKSVTDISAFATTWDYPTLMGTVVRTALEEAPASLRLIGVSDAVGIDPRGMEQMTRTPKILGRQFGLDHSLPLICIPHHDCHAWFPYAASPFAQDGGRVAIAVLDGTGDRGSLSLYSAENGAMQQFYCNGSVFDSLGAFYSVISSTQGGWTWLSSEGRYMGAAAWGDMDRGSNRYYARLREVLHFGDNGEIRLNRAMARWHIDPFDNPYQPALTDILGPPLTRDQLWNPDAVLRVEDIQHRPDTQDRLDKAAATQMVFEDALIHVITHLLRTTGTNRLILSGGVALNALANMRLLEHFDRTWFAREMGRDATLELWVPPMPGDAGTPVGAAWRLAHLAGAPIGEPITHAFYCGAPPDVGEIKDALAADDIASEKIGEVSTIAGREAIADLMAQIVAANGIIALYQGAAETGPRALGHRSIFANPCDPQARERLNERVKYREAIRPLAPMATLEAAQTYFDLQNGASAGDYNAYNYMVLTARSKPNARDTIPAVMHADGTGRIQIVRQDDDPLTFAYLKALGRRIGVEMSVNTSFNVAGPIAQTPIQAIETLRRSKGLDAVIMIAANGEAFAAWHGNERDSGRFSGWLSGWKTTTASGHP